MATGASGSGEARLDSLSLTRTAPVVYNLSERTRRNLNATDKERNAMGTETSEAAEPKRNQDYDTPWKKVLETYYEEFVRFFFPDMAEDIDWDKGYEFLDKELQQIAKDAALGRRLADQLARVRRKSGEEKWVLNHAEIQGKGQNEFEERMYVYNYRIFDRYGRKVASLAILADDNPSWRPDHYSYELWGSRAGLWFPTVKLLDYRERWDELEESANPFASVVMAHLKAMETGKAPGERYRWKLYLIKRLYRLGYGRRDVILLFEFIDWVMTLPKDLEKSFRDEIQEMEEERKMPYISSVQRLGREEGLEEGRKEGREEGTANLLERMISKRFDIERQAVAPIFEGLKTGQIEELADLFVEADSLDEIRRRADEMREASRRG